MLRISQLKINISDFYKKNKEQIDNNGWQIVFGGKEQELVEKKTAKQLLLRIQ